MSGPACLEVFGQLQTLTLVVRGDAGPVKRLGLGHHAFIDQPPDDLAMFQHEGGLVTAHFKHAARSGPAGGIMTETGIEEPGVMHAEFAHHGHIGGHFGGVIGRDRHGLLADEDIEGPGIQDDAFLARAHGVAAPVEKRIWFSRMPGRTSTEKLRGQISAYSGPW